MLDMIVALCHYIIIGSKPLMFKKSKIMTIYVNNKEVESFNFSGGECHVKVNPEQISGVTYIVAKLNSSNSIMQLIMAVDAVRQVNADTRIELTIPYFPYARQDRVCNEGEALGVKVMADLINQLNCDKITVVDPHSDVTVKYINNCEVISLSDIITQSVLANKIKDEQITVIAPDKGAREKVLQVSEKLNADFVCASKVRDSQTGHITNTELHGDVSGKDCIILDDICDGGRTFTQLAKVLQEGGAEKIYLYVTHGIFSHGVKILKEYFDHVYCHHLIKDKGVKESSFLTVLNKE